MKLNKEAKIKLLENFYGLDFVFFGKPVKKVEVCCPVLVTEYFAVKGALLSTLIEMYRLVDYTPKEIAQKVTTKKLIESGSKVASWCREKAGELMMKKVFKKHIKEQVSKIIEKDPSKKKDIEKITTEKIQEKAFSISIDNLLIARMLAESKHFAKLNDWKGRILEDAYKILRDNLIECVMSMNEDAEEPGEFDVGKKN